MTDLVNQPSSEPTRKTTAVITSGVLATAVSVVFGWIMRQYFNIEVPGEVQVAVASIVNAAAAYLTKERA